MPQKPKEKTEFVCLEDIYVSVALSVGLANQQLQRGETGEISYAVVESDISLPYRDIVHEEGKVLLKLPKVGSPTEGLQRITFKVKPVPHLISLEKRWGSLKKPSKFEQC